MSPNALLLLADGAEEMEVVITADVLRRAAVSIQYRVYTDLVRRNDAASEGYN